MKITAAMLRKHGACEYQVKIFCKEWPNGAVVNEKNALRAVELELDVGWLATNLLSVAVWASYRKARDAASAAYRKAADVAETQYQKAVALAFVDAVKQMEKRGRR